MSSTHSEYQQINLLVKQQWLKKYNNIITLLSLDTNIFDGIKLDYCTQEQNRENVKHLYPQLFKDLPKTAKQIGEFFWQKRCGNECQFDEIIDMISGCVFWPSM